MKVLVVGSRSFVGRRIRAHLASHHEVKTAGRDGSADYRIDLAAADVRIEDSFDAIVHCAASFESTTPDGVLANERVNAVGAAHVGKLAIQTGARQVVEISTVSIFWKAPDSYALSKRHAHENLSLLAEHGDFELCTLCPGGIYDEHGEGRRHQPLLYKMVEQARQGSDITLYGKKDPLRNFLFVDDFAAIVKAALEKGLAGTFPALFPRHYHLREIAHLAHSVFGKGGRVVLDEAKPDIPELDWPDGSALWDRVGKPPTDLEKGFALMRDANA